MGLGNIFNPNKKSEERPLRFFYALAAGTHQAK